MSTSTRKTRAKPRITPAACESERDPHRLAKAYLIWRGRQAPAGWSLRYWRGDFWVWDGSRYYRLEDCDLRADIALSIKREYDRWAAAVARKSKPKGGLRLPISKVTTAAVTNVLQALASLVIIPSVVYQPVWIGPRGRKPVIAMKNGLVDLDRLLRGAPIVLQAHSPEWFSPVCLTYSFEPGAECPLFDAFLQQIFENDEQRIALVWEWMGYCLTFDTSFEKFLIAIGEGANGKSVFMSVFIALLGEENVSGVPLELFGVRFQLASTLGKLANIVSEISATDHVAEAILKAYVSGNRMNFDRKFKSSVEMSPTARLSFTTNELPKFKDKSEGIWRRLIVLPFKTVIPEDQRDPRLAEKLKAELPGIFNGAIEGLRRLHANRQFTKPDVCAQKLEESRVDNDSARAFLTCVRVQPGAQVPCQTLQQQYGLWCASNDYEPIDGRGFGKEVVRRFPSLKRIRGQRDASGYRPWIYEGIEYVAEEGSPPAIPTPRPFARLRSVAVT